MTFGRLERTQGPQPMSDINMTPLIDVMLVLLVIFILTAPLLASALRLELPRSDAGQALAPGAAVPPVQLALDAAGQTYLNEQPLPLPVLQERLQALAARAPQTEVHLRADAAAPYGQVVALMGAAQKAGLNRIAFVAKP